MTPRNDRHRPRAGAEKPVANTASALGELENKGANDFGSIMRCEPPISATGASGGSGNGKAASTAEVTPATTFAVWRTA